MKFLIVSILTVFLCSSVKAGDEEAQRRMKKLGKTLRKELKAKLKESPEKALDYCNLNALKITNEFNDSHYKFGRISDKNRNPSNLPQKWMRQYMDQIYNKETTESFHVVDLGGGKRGYLRPIPTVPDCLVCHGENISSSLKAEIDKRYPNDKAKNHIIGDIRGFFWATYNP